MTRTTACTAVFNGIVITRSRRQRSPARVFSVRRTMNPYSQECKRGTLRTCATNWIQGFAAGAGAYRSTVVRSIRRMSPTALYIKPHESIEDISGKMQASSTRSGVSSPYQPPPAAFTPPNRSEPPSGVQ